MASMRDLVDDRALDDDEENDESFDEDTGEVRDKKSKQNRSNGDLDDSSEEEDDDDDEEAARQIREGFIVDEDEDEEEEHRIRRREKKRNRSERELEEVLDEEDYDIIGEANPEFASSQATSQPKLKRLKRGHRNDVREREPRLDDIFSDDELPQDLGDRRNDYRQDHRQIDEFADFIEEDDIEDEDERLRLQEELEVARPRERGYTGAANAEATGMDQDTLDDMEAIFGGDDYDWALAMEEDDAAQAGAHDQQLELKDVFEPSQLAEKLLTDEDNIIRVTDEPERFQLARKPYQHVQLSGDEFQEESKWISDLVFPKKGFTQKNSLQQPFEHAVHQVLQFFMTDQVEVPFVFQHRKDYLIHGTKVPDGQDSNGQPLYRVKAERLLNQDDLWHILDLDLKFRALVDKRRTLGKTYDNLKTLQEVDDPMFEEMLPKASTMEELQDLQDYLYFRYAAKLKDLASHTNSNQSLRRPGNKSSNFERIRNGTAYNLVKAFGIDANQVGQNFLKNNRRHVPEDPPVRPIDLADTLTSVGEFSTGEHVLAAAKNMFAEELVMCPRVRNHFRREYYTQGMFSCHRTEKGLRKLDEQHQFYEVKYLRNQSFSDLARKPDLFLKMLKAEEEGLVEIRIKLEQEAEFRRQLGNEFVSDNFSEIADAWNGERKKVLDMAFTRLEKIMVRGVKENMRAECQDQLASACREEYSKKLDQAPYKPKGMVLGTIPRVLAISNGTGGPGAAICWAWMEEDGRVLENGKFNNLSRDEKEREAFVELVERRRPDVIGIGGFSVETDRLVKDIRGLISEKDLRGAEYEDPHTDQVKSEPLEVIIVNDEVARLYKDSERAALEHPALPPVTRYCVALAKYLQSPMKEYAALGKDIVSLQFHKNQQLIPEEKLRKALETAMVDMVNLCGVDINEAAVDPYTANLLPYICGLGPRKATSFLKAININGGVVNSRAELVGDPDNGKVPVAGPIIWTNCASFLYIEYDPSSPSSDYLDNTRVHPEDYELGKKMAADALELDEEDVNAEQEENGPGAVIRKLIKDDEQDKVNDLVLEEYAEQLEQRHSQRKRATLETIRAELQSPYEELRRNLIILSESDIFTMFTGETSESLYEGVIVSANLKIVKDDFIIARLDSGIEGRVEQGEATDKGDVPLTRLFQVDKTYQAKLLALDMRSFSAVLALRQSAVLKPAPRYSNRDPALWDEEQEKRDQEELKEKDKATGRTQRVIRHPLFRAFSSAQAGEFLGSQSRGDAVIRLSSKGSDHLAVTWKVADGVYQHIDVLELGKENEFSVGKELRVGSDKYSDLDELIVERVKAMSRKVDEMMQHEKFQPGTKTDAENWLTTYTEANPKRSVYVFCLNTKRPGWFWLVFKAGKEVKVNSWPVRIIPNAFELMNSKYGDMKSLCNGFKIRHQKEMEKLKSKGVPGRMPVGR